MTSFARAALSLVPRRDDVVDGPPLAIAGVFARGHVVTERLVDALLGMDDASLRRLRGVRALSAPGAPSAPSAPSATSAASAEEVPLVVVIGPEELLPWRDGVRYLGVAAPGLYVPTTRATSLPAALAAEALQRYLPAAWIDDVTLVPLRAGLPLSQAAIVRGMQAMPAADAAKRERGAEGA